MELVDILEAKLIVNESDDEDDHWGDYTKKQDEISRKFAEGFVKHTHGIIKYPKNLTSFIEEWLWGGGPGFHDPLEEAMENLLNGYLKQAFDYDYQDPAEDGLLKVFKEFGLSRGEYEWFMDNIG